MNVSKKRPVNDEVTRFEDERFELVARALEAEQRRHHAAMKHLTERLEQLETERVQRMK